MVKGFCQVQTAPVMSTSQNSDTDGGAELGKLRTGGQAEPAPGLSPGMDIPDRIPSATGRYGIPAVCGRVGQGGN